MPNIYDDLLNDDEPKKPQADSLKSDPIYLNDVRFPINEEEPLDEILDKIKQFNQDAEAFSRLLSKTKAIDHKVQNSFNRLFFVSEDEHDQGSLVGERRYHHILCSKFETIIMPMRDLAALHLDIVQQFNRDIDKHYYSVEKTDSLIEEEKKAAENGINLQRKILADATNSLSILQEALNDTERRIKNYVNAGGQNNISIAEYEMIVQRRLKLTSGKNHQFDYTVFDVNVLDKMVLSLGIYKKETTTQYLGTLAKALRHL